jgi:hypothetical protein
MPMGKTAGRPFKDSIPDPKNREHRRKALRIREKRNKATAQELDWLCRFDLAKSGATVTLESPAAAPTAADAPTEAKPDEVGAPEEPGAFSAPLTARAVTSSSAEPAPVPGLAPAPSAKVAPSAPPRPTLAASPAPVPAAGSAPKPVDESLFVVASPAIQAARYDALVMIFSQVADGFEELQVKIETTMQGQKWVMPREFWRGPWLTMTVGLFNRYLPEWMSGPIVEGVTVVMPPVALVRAAYALEKAGYVVGEPGEPGRGKGLAVAAQKAASAPPKAPEPPKAPDTAPVETRPLRERKEDSTANPPAKRNGGAFDVRKAFGGGN